MEGDVFSFFSNLQIYSKIYPSYYCKLALQSVLIRGFQKLFAFKACLHICVNEFERFKRYSNQYIYILTLALLSC